MDNQSMFKINQPPKNSEKRMRVGKIASGGLTLGLKNLIDNDQAIYYS
jgi:hypothetical protein